MEKWKRGSKIRKRFYFSWKEIRDTYMMMVMITVGLQTKRRRKKEGEE